MLAAGWWFYAKHWFVSFDWLLFGSLELGRTGAFHTVIWQLCLGICWLQSSYSFVRVPGDLSELFSRASSLKQRRKCCVFVFITNKTRESSTGNRQSPAWAQGAIFLPRLAFTPRRCSVSSSFSLFWVGPTSVPGQASAVFMLVPGNSSEKEKSSPISSRVREQLSSSCRLPWIPRSPAAFRFVCRMSLW